MVRKINWLPLQRAIWRDWLKSPEALSYISEHTYFEVGGYMYETFIVEAIARALDLLADTIGVQLFGKDSAKTIGDPNTRTKVDKIIAVE